MSGECSSFSEHCLDCKCKENPNLEFAMTAFNIAMQQFYNAGYELKKIEFEKRNDKN